MFLSENKALAFQKGSVVAGFYEPQEEHTGPCCQPRRSRACWHLGEGRPGTGEECYLAQRHESAW